MSSTGSSKIDYVKSVLNKAKVISSIVAKCNHVYVAQRIVDFYQGFARAFEIASESVAIQSILQEARPKITKEAVIGISDILTKQQVELAAQWGADFVSSYIYPYPEYAEDCHKHGLVCIAGAATTEEIDYAYSQGVDYVQVFPIDLFGINKFLEMCRVKPPQTLIAAGVESTRISSYIDSGAFLVTSGGSFIGCDLEYEKSSFEFTIAHRDYEQFIKNDSLDILQKMHYKNVESLHIMANEEPRTRSRGGNRAVLQSHIEFLDGPTDYQTSSGRSPQFGIAPKEKFTGRQPPGGRSTIQLG